MRRLGFLRGHAGPAGIAMTSSTTTEGLRATGRAPRSASSADPDSRSFVMHPEIAPPVPTGDDPVAGVLGQLAAALAACLDEIESLQRRVARLEAERERPA